MKRILLSLTVLAAMAFSAPVLAKGAPATAKQQQAIELIQAAETAISENKWFEAEKHLKKAKKLDKENPKVYKLLGDFHTAFNRDYKAEFFYKKAEELQNKQ